MPWHDTLYFGTLLEVILYNYHISHTLVLRKTLFTKLTFCWDPMPNQIFKPWKHGLNPYGLGHTLGGPVSRPWTLNLFVSGPWLPQSGVVQHVFTRTRFWLPKHATTTWQRNIFGILGDMFHLLIKILWTTEHNGILCICQLSASRKRDLRWLFVEQKNSPFELEFQRVDSLELLVSEPFEACKIMI